MKNDSELTKPTSQTKNVYSAPRLTVFGGLRELTLQQQTIFMPDDNNGQGGGGKPASGTV